MIYKNKLLLIIATFILSTFFSYTAGAQTKLQKVKVRTRVTANLKGGAPIAGAEVKFVGGNRHMSGRDGMFTFTVRGKFEIESASKQGYVMIDPKYLKGFTSYTPDVIPVIMEERNKLNRETERQTQRINKQLSDENERLMRLNDSLLAAKVISEAKYDSLEQSRSNDYLSKVDKVRAMAEAFANIDYEILEEYDRQVYKALSEGNYDEAYRLLKSHKSVEELKKEIDATTAAIDVTEQMLAAAKQGRDVKIKEAADQCYRWFEYYKARFMNDSAAYYLEQRAMLDTTNVDWLNYAGKYIGEYLANYSQEEYYYKKAQRQAISQYGEKSSWNATILSNLGHVNHTKGEYSLALHYFQECLKLEESIEDIPQKKAKTFNNIGNVYYELGDYDTALIYFTKALNLQEQFADENANDIAHSYNDIGATYLEMHNHVLAEKYIRKGLSIARNINEKDNYLLSHYYLNMGGVFKLKGELDTSLIYYDSAMILSKNVLGEKHPLVASLYENIAEVFFIQEKYDEYLNIVLTKVLPILEKVYGSNHISVETTCNNIAWAYFYKKEYEKSLFYFEKTLKPNVLFYGENSLSVARVYKNLAMVLSRLNEREKSISYYRKAIHLREKILGKNHKDVSVLYYNIAFCYTQQGDLDSALANFLTCISIEEKVYGEESLETATTYNNVGIVYYRKNDYEKALEYVQKAYTIRKNKLGANDTKTVSTGKKIEEIKAKLQEGTEE